MVPVIALFAVLLATAGPSVAVPVALAMFFATRGRAGPPFRRRGRRRRAVRHGFDGTREIWDLRGVRIALDPHQVKIDSSTRGRFTVSLHEVQAIEITGREVRLIGIDGRVARLGRARANQESLRQARVAIAQGLEQRRRGGLEDKLHMVAELDAVRAKDVVG